MYSVRFILAIHIPRSLCQIQEKISQKLYPKYDVDLCLINNIVVKLHVSSAIELLKDSQSFLKLNINNKPTIYLFFLN